MLKCLRVIERCFMAFAYLSTLVSILTRRVTQKLIVALLSCATLTLCPSFWYASQTKKVPHSPCLEVKLRLLNMSMLFVIYIHIVIFKCVNCICLMLSQCCLNVVGDLNIGYITWNPKYRHRTSTNVNWFICETHIWSFTRVSYIVKIEIFA